MALRDWHALSLARRGRLVHVRTDPACIIHTAARPGSMLDRVSRGVECRRCAVLRAEFGMTRENPRPCVGRGYICPQHRTVHPPGWHASESGGSE